MDVPDKDYLNVLSRLLTAQQRSSVIFADMRDHLWWLAFGVKLGIVMTVIALLVVWPF